MNFAKKDESILKLKGSYTIKSYKAGELGLREVVKTFQNGNSYKTFEPTVDVSNLVPTFEISKENIIVCSTDFGVNLLLNQMGNNTTYPIGIDSIALGTGTTTPAITDTSLEAETVSAVTIASFTVVNNELTMDIFIPSLLLPDGLYTEIGTKMAGRLFSRSVMSYLKTASQDTTIEYKITYQI